MSEFKIGQKFIHTASGQVITVLNTSHWGGYYLVRFEKTGFEDLWSSNVINKHLKAGTWKLPIGYQTPLWKVLNGESIEDE